MNPAHEGECISMEELERWDDLSKEEKDLIQKKARTCVYCKRLFMKYWASR